MECISSAITIKKGSNRGIAFSAVVSIGSKISALSRTANRYNAYAWSPVTCSAMKDIGVQIRTYAGAAGRIDTRALVAS